MKKRLVTVSGFRGPEKQLLPEIGELIEFDRDVEHGDWKTSSVRPGQWPTIQKGTKCKVVGDMQNFYGVFIKVEHNGSIYDVEHYKIVGLK